MGLNTITAGARNWGMQRMKDAGRAGKTAASTSTEPKDRVELSSESGERVGNNEFDRMAELKRRAEKHKLEIEMRTQSQMKFLRPETSPTTGGR